MVPRYSVGDADKASLLLDPRSRGPQQLYGWPSQVYPLQGSFDGHSSFMPWEFDQSEFLNHALHTGGGGKSTDLYLDDDGDLEVTTVQGRGHCREETTAFIPLDVLVKMLEHAGYKVTK